MHYTIGIVTMNGYATERITATMTPFWYRKRFEVWYGVWRESGTQYKFEYFKRCRRDLDTHRPPVLPWRYGMDTRGPDPE
jgi:hypothetical protein